MSTTKWTDLARFGKIQFDIRTNAVLANLYTDIGSVRTQLHPENYNNAFQCVTAKLYEIQDWIDNCIREDKFTGEE